MDFSEWTERIGNLIDILERDRQSVFLKNVSDMLSLVTSRIINERKGPDGSAFDQYSEAVVPVWFFGSQDTRRDSATAIEELFESVGYFASYKDWREVNNLDGDDINFSFTGKMWASLQPLQVKNTSEETVIGWFVQDVFRDEILGYHIRRFPDLLDLSPAELTIMDTLNQARIDKAIQEAGLS